MTPSARECEAVRRLWVEEALGRALGPGERALCDRHVESCPECRAESAALARLRDPDGPGPAPHLDDLARRRWIERTVERSNLAPVGGAPERRLPRGRIAAAAGIAAAVALAVAAAVWIPKEGPPPTPGAEAIAPAGRAVAPTPAARAIGRLLMTSGDVSASPAGAPGDRGLAAGGVLETRAGIAVASMEGGVSLRLGRDTGVELLGTGPSSPAVRLLRGELLVAVDPNRKERAFRVLVGDAEVVVRGTIFSVSSPEGGAASVGVFRGEVAVSGPGGERRVRAGERFAVGDPAVGAIGEEATRAAEGAMDALSALSDGGSAFLEVESLPTGASVSVDGIELGSTPLAVSLRPGYRRLELGPDGGRGSVRELLRLAEGTRTSRTFDLSAGQPAAAGSPKAGEPRAPKAPSANELLAEARDRRASGDFSGAIAAYERLIVGHPDAPVSRAALVSLGQLYLDQGGNPGRGLELFGRYLASARSGALAQEASFGVAAAHRALGDTAAERAALEAFLRDFGGSNQAPRAAARLAELR